MIPLSSYLKIQNDVTSTVVDTQYLVKISNDIYIASRKQMFGVDESTAQYYEDRDLKISGLSESINLKTKKAQLSKVNIKLSNFEIRGKRISDILFKSPINTNLLKFILIF